MTVGTGEGNGAPSSHRAAPPASSRFPATPAFRIPLPQPRGVRIRRLARATVTAAAVLAAFAAIDSPLPAAAGDTPFTAPSNFGLTGLLDTPTARVMPVNSLRAGGTRIDPYRYYFLGVSPFRWLEVSGRLTEVAGVPAFTNLSASSYGNFKDKAVDVKVQFIPEGMYAPAIAVVVMDPHGTRIYPAQALVASKQIFPFDFTVGIGNGRYGKRPLPESGEAFRAEMFTSPGAWWRDAQLFGGIEFAPTETLSIVAEYSPVRYHIQDRDPAQPKYFRDPVPSKFNVGLRWKPVRWAEIDASYQRGNRIGVGISTTFDMGKPFVPIYDAPYRERPADHSRRLEDRIAAAFDASGFSDIGVASDGLTLRVEAQNDRYFFTPRAVDEALSILARTGRGNAQYVRVTIKDNGIPLAELVTTGAAVDDLAAGVMSLRRLFEVSTFRTDESETAVRDTVHRRRLAYGVKPSVDTFLNDPARFFSFRAGLTGWLHASAWRGGTAVAGVETYPVNNVSTLNAPLSIPVRSDIALYKKEGAALSRLFFEQIEKRDRGVHGRLAAGYLETMYAGVDAEAAVPLWSGRVFLGAGGSYVRKRPPDSPLRLSQADFHTAFLNARLNIVEWDVQADIKAGRFLAGDKGASLTLSKFVNGFVLSAWYTVTDTSVFSDPFNRGYHDKGISLSIPLRMFIGRDSKTVYRYRLSPWTRDAGQDIERERTLFDFIGRNTPLHLDRDRKALYFRE